MKKEKRALTLIAIVCGGVSVVAGIGDVAAISLVGLLGFMLALGARIQTGRLASRVEQALDGARFVQARS